MDKRAKREAATARLRKGFLERAASEVSELSAMLGESPDPELVDSVVFSLVRLSETARSLGLPTVASGLNEAAVALPTDGMAAMDAAREAFSAEGERARVAPVVVVLSDPLLRGRMEAVAERFSETIRFVDDVAAIKAMGPLGAAVISHHDLARVPMLRGRFGCPVYVFGPARLIQARVKSLAAGADGYLPEPLDLSSVVFRVRRRPVSLPAAQVLLVAPADLERDRFEESLRRGGLVTLATDHAGTVVMALEEVGPDAVVVAERVADLSARQLVGLVRSHARYQDVPILVWNATDPLSALELGADECVSGSDEAAARLLAARVARHRLRDRDRESSTGLLCRAGALDRLDELVSDSRRHGHLVTVGIVTLSGIEEARKRWGHAAWFTGRRLLGEVLSANLRLGDLAGHLDATSFLVALPHCRLEDAERRFAEIRERFLRRCRKDRRLRAVSFEWGFTDSRKGHRGLLARADRAAQRKVPAPQ